MRVERPLAGISVLVVEDHEDCRRMLERVIELLGGMVGSARQGAEALQMMEAGRVFDVVVSDLQMPVMNGVELVRAIRAAGRTLPCIAVTAAMDPGEALQAGFNAVLRKPLRMDGLMNEILGRVPRPEIAGRPSEGTP